MNYLLFTTTSCPKCPRFKEFVQTYIKVPGEVLDEKHKSFETFSRQFMVNSVPTLFIFEDEEREHAIIRTDDVSDIYDFIQKT